MFVTRLLVSSLTLSSLLLGALPAHAQVAALLVASDPARIAAVDLVKVVSTDGSAWLGVRLNGRARLAIVTEEAALEAAPRASDWLRALDFVTRMRVAPPSGSLPSCGDSSALELADSGLPEPPLLGATRTVVLDSELELSRELVAQGVPIDAVQLARFTSLARAPFRVASYQGNAEGGVSAAVRFVAGGGALELPQVIAAGLDSVPVNLIALSTQALVAEGDAAADPSEFAVTYRGGSVTSDYPEARSSWLAQHSEQWLSEAQGNDALFAWTSFPYGETLLPATARYFQALPYARASACQKQIDNARGRASLTFADYVCEGSDDLALTLAELGFREPRLSRLFGALSVAPPPLGLQSRAPRYPRLEATDFDVRDCPPPQPPGPMSFPPPDSTGSEPQPRGDEQGPVYYEPAPVGPGYVEQSTSCNLVIVGDDSCSGDSSGSEPAAESCSGDSSSDDSYDSCSGDSSSDDGPESCSGDSSSDDSDSCSGDSEYDGDTCAGDTATDSHASLSPKKPRKVRLSLLSFVLAALALPLRRRPRFR